MRELVTRPWPMSQPIYDSPYVTSVVSPSGRNLSNDDHLSEYHEPRSEFTEEGYYDDEQYRLNNYANEVRALTVAHPRNATAAVNDGDCRIEMVPLNPAFSHSSCKNTSDLVHDDHSSSVSSCVSWLKLKTKKAVKKLQQKIGIGNRVQHNYVDNLRPLTFNNHIYGDHVTLSHDGFVARRITSFCKGIVFSDRPIKIKERVYVKITEVMPRWVGCLRIGLTNHDPSMMRHSLPDFAVNGLTSKSGFWAKEVRDVSIKKNTVIHFYVKSSGNVYYGVDGEYKGKFLTGVDTQQPLYVIIDIYGSTTGVEFVDPRSQINNSMRI